MDVRSTITTAKALRKSMTGSEQRLWRLLRRRSLDGVRFRRQHVLGPYIVDFFCSSCRLAIEIDGGVHEDEEWQLKDADRDRWMAGQGVRVLRLPDRIVRDNIDAVLRTILDAVECADRRSPR